MTDSPDTPTELVQATSERTDVIGVWATGRVLDAVPDGWAKRNGQWVKEATHRPPRLSTDERNKRVTGVPNPDTGLTDEQYEAIYHRPRPGDAQGEQQMNGSPDTPTDRESMMLAVLDDLEQSVRVADIPRAAFIGFVWAQRRDYLLAGTETWADQRIPAPVLGGATAIIERPKP